MLFVSQFYVLFHTSSEMYSVWYLYLHFQKYLHWICLTGIKEVTDDILYGITSDLNVGNS